MSKKVIFLIFLIVSLVSIIFVNFFGTRPDIGLAEISEINFLTYDKLTDNGTTKWLYLIDHTNKGEDLIVVLEYQIGPRDDEKGTYPIHDLSAEIMETNAPLIRISQYVNDSGFKVYLTFSSSEHLKSKIFTLTIRDKKQTQVFDTLYIRYFDPNSDDTTIIE